MRLARLWIPSLGGSRYAREVGEEWHWLAGDPTSLPGPDSPVEGRVARAQARLLAPLRPGKIVCIGRNYAAHARELGNDVPREPTLFLKPPSSVIGPGDFIERPTHLSSLVHHEGELAVIVGATLRHVSESGAWDGIFGYTCANDVTARDLQRSDQIFTRAKGFDTFCPLGPAIVTPDELPDPHGLALRVTVDGEIRQSGHTGDMIFRIPTLLSYISSIMTLEPGDVVLTGTPAGVGPLEAGQRVTVDVDGIGELSNLVRNRPTL